MSIELPTEEEITAALAAGGDYAVAPPTLVNVAAYMCNEYDLETKAVLVWLRKHTASVEDSMNNGFLTFEIGDELFEVATLEEQGG